MAKSEDLKNIYIGTAAWTIPKDYKDRFTETGTHLERYSTRLNAVEINTSFYRDHKASSYEKWAGCVPEEFRFTVKLSQIFTHEQRLKKGPKDLHASLQDIMKLSTKLGCILIQLPPSLNFVFENVDEFFNELRTYYSGPVAFEPRHASWDEAAAYETMNKYNISKVIADPLPYLSERSDPQTLHGFTYFRLHGSPEVYKSDYEINRLTAYADQIKKLFELKQDVWCIFDNTTFGHATGNALTLKSLLS